MIPGKPRITYFYILLSIIFSAVSCTYTHSRDAESAQKVAEREFKDRLASLRYDWKMFRGPELVEENKQEFTFQWCCLVPKPCATMLRIYVPRDPKGHIGLRFLGERDRTSFLENTRRLPANEAILRNLFELPLDPNDENGRSERLRKIPLDMDQLEDMANFLEIKRELAGYSYCFNRRYPDGLDEVEIYSRGNRCVNKLDSLYTHDRYGKSYVYENLINFVILGSPGANGRWDFDSAVMDSIYQDHVEHIRVMGDDIIVKFNPLP